jgi:nucleoside-diphosphate-sugar epimerase
VRVLVTGASSLLGRTVALQLASRGDAVSCFQRSSSGTGLLDRPGDIRDRSALLSAAEGHDAVVHLAALVAPRAPWSLAYDVNVNGTAHAVDAGAACGRLVHISTPSVAFAGSAAMGVGSEPASYRGRDSYARSKALAELLVLERSTAPTVIIRPHLVWGPGDTQLVGRIVSRARQGRLLLPDHGRALIDTTYLDDAASGIVAALDRATPGSAACGRAWVVTGADPRPVAELVGGILRAAGVSVEPRSVPAPLASFAGGLLERLWPGSEPPLTHFAARQLSVAHWFDQREVQAVLGWKPQVSVQEGMSRLAAWFRASTAA